jgi:glycosyltransferase involved in cell wall biosynthesis
MEAGAKADSPGSSSVSSIERPKSASRNKEVSIRLLVTSFRLRHTDGVSVEATKAERIFAGWGWEIVELAGEYGHAVGRTSPCEPLPALEVGESVIAQVCIPELSIAAAAPLKSEGLWEGKTPRIYRDPTAADLQRLKISLRNCFDAYLPDAVLVENVFGLPLNPLFAEALRDVLIETGRPALIRHHDLAWQREEFHFSRLHQSLRARFEELYPPRLENAVHIVINSLSAEQLKERGFESLVIHNGFAIPEPEAALERAAHQKPAARRRLGIGDQTLLLVQPTRAIERKGVPDAIALGQKLARSVSKEVVLLVCGPVEDGYERPLKKLLREVDAVEIKDAQERRPSGASGGRGSFRMMLGRGELPIDLAYDAADFIVFPSNWEGFGNPVIESVMWAKPLVARRYPVMNELEATGLRFIPWDPDPVRGVMAWLEKDELSKREALIANLEVARRYFSLEVLEKKLLVACEKAGVRIRGER